MTEALEILVVGGDPLIPQSLAGIAEELGATIRVARSTDESTLAAAAPLVVVIDVAMDEGISVTSVLRARFPKALLAGSLAIPRRDLWDAALAAGCDVVTNRGALASRLRAKLAGWDGPPQAARLRLLEVVDVAGRIGLVARIADAPTGPLAVYHLGGRLFVTQDVCPHAGARLSTGELEGAVLTCPLHGSQFDVSTGARLRGPADDGIATYAVVIDGGVAYAELPQP